MRNNRSILVAGNWKEDFSVSQSSHLLHRLQEVIPMRHGIEVALFPNTLVLQPLSVQLDRRKFRLGAQDGYYVDNGAYTGEVSMAMLKALVHYVLVGHSERRHIFNEPDDIISKKVAAAIRNDIMPVLCVGENIQERLAGETNQVLHDQITTGLMHLTAHEVGLSVIAYEPVCAIGTGESAKPDQLESVIKFVRKQVKDLFGEKASRDVRILYGGSVDEHVARSYMEIEGCDGVLVGGASLNYHKFAGIVEAAYRVQQGRMEKL